MSGFVIIVENYCLWTTAGHCLKALDRQIKKGKMRILDSAFGDSYGSEARHSTTIPFAYTPGCGQYVHDDPDGIDFGFIELTWNMVYLLQANKVIAIDERMWRHAHDVTYDVYRVQGVPTCLTVEETDRSATLKPILLPLERIDISTVEEASSPHWLSFQIPEEIELESMDGMSGGVVYGFYRVGSGMAYHPIGIQSGWHPDQRVAVASDLRLCCESLASRFRELLAQVEDPPAEPT